MLWYKSWLETRWRFLIGLILLICSAAGAVIAYPKLMELMPLASTIEVKGELGRRIKESVQLAREYRGYVWSHWFRQNLAQIWTLFAVLLGTGGLLSQSSGGGTLYTLSMPASRTRLLGVRAATGLAELFVLALGPSLVIPMLSPTIGKTYSVADVLVHGACLFIAGTVFFSLAVLLSTMFSDLWRPSLMALSLAFAWAFSGQFFHQVSRYSIFRVMSAEVYFSGGELPWLGMLFSVAASAAMLYGAKINIARRDF